MWFDFIRVMFALLIVIGLLLVVLKMAQKPLRTFERKGLKVIDQLKLSPRHSLTVVKMGADYLVVGTSDQQLNVIHQLSSEEGEKMEQRLDTITTREDFKTFIKRKEVSPDAKEK